MKGIKWDKKIVFCTILLISLIPHTMRAYNTRTINPFSILIGSSAVDHSENIYTINPASIGFMQSVMLFQNFSLNKNQDNIIYSQNLAFKLSSAHSFLLGYSMVENKIAKENSLFQLNYALNLGDFLYIGANFNYKDKHYKKFHKKNLKTDLGLIFSLKPDNTIKFINFGAYSLDANVEKISLNLPNTNFGQYSALGFAFGLDISDKMDMVLSADIDQVRDNKILSKKEKIYKYGIQLNFGDTSFLSSLKAATEYYGRDSVENPSSGYSAGATFNLSLFKLTYAYKYNSISGENNQYLSAAFQLSDNNNNKKEAEEVDNKELNEEKIEIDDRINMTCYQEDGNYKILFHGDSSDLVIWKIYIVGEKGEIVMYIQSEDELPEYIIWNFKDIYDKEISDGIYTINFVYIKDSEDLKLYDEHQKVKIVNGQANRINMTYYQEDGNYKIVFHGDRSKINYWRFDITDMKGKTLKDLDSTDKLPGYIIWDGKDFNGKEIGKGTYKLKLFIVKGENMEQIYEEESDMKVN